MSESGKLDEMASSVLIAPCPEIRAAELLEINPHSALSPVEADGTAKMKMLRRFFHDAGGATSIEYAIIASLLSIAIVVAVAALGSSLKVRYDSVSDALGSGQ
jgi:pilus assembly protein Flp/PilA